jgi:hypothetical protein
LKLVLVRVAPPVLPETLPAKELDLLWFLLYRNNHSDEAVDVVVAVTIGV